MKPSIILMSFSALLFASSGILSQPTDDINAITKHAAPDNPSDGSSAAFTSAPTVPGLNDTNQLVLAKINNIDEVLTQRLKPTTKHQASSS